MSLAYSKATLFDRILPYALSLFNTFQDLLEILPSFHLEQKRLGLLGDAHTNTYTHRWRISHTPQTHVTILLLAKPGAASAPVH
jgi:hypothetical protein